MLTSAEEQSHHHQQSQQNNHQQQLHHQTAQQQPSNGGGGGGAQMSHQMFVFGGGKVVEPGYGGKPPGGDGIGLDDSADGGGEDYEDGDYEETSGEDDRLSSMLAMIGNSTNKMLASQPSTAGTYFRKSIWGSYFPSVHSFGTRYLYSIFNIRVSYHPVYLYFSSHLTHADHPHVFVIRVYLFGAKCVGGADCDVW